MSHSLLVITVWFCLLLPVSFAAADDVSPASIEPVLPDLDVIEATGFSTKVQDRSLACDLAGERAKVSLRRAIEAARHLGQARAQHILNHGTFKYRTRWEPERTTCTVRLELALPPEPISSSRRASTRP